MVLSRTGSTEAVPKERPGLYIGASRISVQSKAGCAARKSAAATDRVSEQTERAQLLKHLGRQLWRSLGALPVRRRVFFLEIAPALERPLRHLQRRHQPHVVRNDAARQS